MNELLTDTLIDEYETIIANLGEGPTDDAIIAALVTEGDWTPVGARAVLTLARTYGTFILSNALALATNLEIEDGSSGL